MHKITSVHSEQVTQSMVKFSEQSESTGEMMDRAGAPK